MAFLANHLDWLALAVGAIGSFLWAHNGESAKHASVWWLVSSLLWIAFAWLHGMPALGVRDLLGIGTAAYGCYRWRRPREGVAATNGLAQRPAPSGASRTDASLLPGYEGELMATGGAGVQRRGTAEPLDPEPSSVAALMRT